MGRPGPWLFLAYVALTLLTNSSPGVCGTKRGTSYPPFLNQDFGCNYLLLCLRSYCHERGAFIGRPPPSPPPTSCRSPPSPTWLPGIDSARHNQMLSSLLKSCSIDFLSLTTATLAWYFSEFLSPSASKLFSWWRQAWPTSPTSPLGSIIEWNMVTNMKKYWWQILLFNPC